MPIPRIPTQKRSIEKRNRIIEKGFELICEKGYYNTNTTEIAEYASVSTGIIYQYFNDKLEILIEGIKNYYDKIMYPMIDILDENTINYNNLETILRNLIKEFINKHTISKKAHEELMAMSHLNEEISNIFKNKELELTNKIVDSLNNLNIKNVREKVHIIIGIIDNYCHEVVYHKHESINYSIMEDIIIKTIIDILKK